MWGRLVRWRFEVVAVAIALLASAALLWTATPLVGVAGVDERAAGTALQRAVQSFEGRAVDLKFRLRGPRAGHPDVLVLAADERSALRFGRWPWSRDVVARGLDRLLDADVRCIGLDVAFVEATPPPPGLREMLDRLEAPDALPEALGPLREELLSLARSSPDDALEAVLLKGGRRIVQGVFPYAASDPQAPPRDAQAEDQRRLEPSFIRGTHLGRGGPLRSFPAFERLEIRAFTGARAPLARLLGADARVGSLAALTDPDGSIRRAQLLLRLDGPRAMLPSLALQVAAVTLDAEVEPIIEAQRLAAVELWRRDGRTVRVPMEGFAPFMQIDYPGRGDDVPTLSFADVYDGRFDRQALAGKAVLFGVTLTGLTGDQRVTPFQPMEPGVYTHAAVLSNLFEGRALERPVWLALAECGTLVGLALLFARLIPRLQSFAAKGLVITAAAFGWLAVAQWLFGIGLNVAVVLPLASIASSAFAVTFLGYLTVDRQKAQLRSTLARYLGEDVLEVAIANPELLKRGEKRTMTVLFSDIRGFTSLSESMSPEVLRRFVNEYLTRMTQVVFEQRGTLDKYIGDAVMAFWNAPLEQGDHPLRACAAAVGMLEALDELKPRWRALGYPELEIGIGVNTGPMVVGEMGSDVRAEYTVLGDAVNLASRLEGINKAYGTRAIVSETTWREVRGAVRARRLGAVRVKGKSQPVAIYELRGLGSASGGEAEAIRRFEGALEDWRRRDFEAARRGFEAVLLAWPGDPASLRYLEALEALAASPPGPEWDGIVTFEAK